MAQNLNTLGPQPFTANPPQSIVNGGEKAAVIDNGLVAAGRQIGATAIAAQSVDEENETRDALVQTHELRSKYMQQLQDANNSGADISKLQEQFTADQQAIQDNLQYRASSKAAHMANAESSLMFATHAARINAEREGAALKDSVIRHDAASGPMLVQDPGMLPYLIQERNKLVDSMAGRIPPHILDAVKLEGAQQLTITSVQAMIDKSPDFALHALQHHEEVPMWDNLSADARIALVKAAEHKIDANRADEAHARALEQQKKHEADLKALDGMLVNIGEGKIDDWSRNKILTLEGVGPEMKTHMAGLLEAYRKKEDKESTNFSDYYKLVATGKAGQAQIDQALLSDQIQPKEHAYLTSTLKAMEKPDGHIVTTYLQTASRIIAPRDRIGRILAEGGEEKFYEFSVKAEQMADEWKKAGGSVAELFDPASKPYRENMLPLLNKYRPQMGISYNDEKGTASLSPAVGTAANPLIIKPGQEETLTPGTKYKFEHEEHLPTRTKRSSTAPSLNAPDTAVTPPPVVPSKPSFYKPGDMPPPPPGTLGHMRQTPVEVDPGSYAGEVIQGTTQLQPKTGGTTLKGTTQLTKPSAKQEQPGWMPVDAGERDDFVQQYEQEHAELKVQLGRKVQEMKDAFGPRFGFTGKIGQAIVPPRHDRPAYDKALNEYQAIFKKYQEAERRIEIMKKMKF